MLWGNETVNLGQWIGFSALVTSLYILWEIRQVLLLVFAAIVLANSLNLLARWFRHRLGIKRPLAVLLAIGCFVAAIIGFIWLIVPPFVQEFSVLIGLLPKGVGQINSWLDGMRAHIPDQFRSNVPDLDTLGQQAQPYLNRALGGSVALFSSSLGGVVNLLLVLILTLMMLVDPKTYRRVFVRLFPAFYRRRVDSILQECEEALGRWIVGALISMSVVAILSSVGLALLGVRAAFAQGVLAGLLNFIPNLGPTLSVVIPMAIALPDLLKSALVFALYFAIQQFESNLLTPYVMAQQVSLLPAITLLAQVFFATAFGFLGLALAIPLTVVFQIWIRRALVEDVLDRWGKLDQLPMVTKEKEPSSDEAANLIIISETVIQSSENSPNTSENPVDQSSDS